MSLGVRPDATRHLVTPGVGSPWDRGTGLIGTIAGVTVFLALLLFSVHLLVGLHLASTVTGAAYEGARDVAGRRVAHGDPAAMPIAMQDAEHHVRSLLGRIGDRAELDWTGTTDETVVLRIRVDAPRLGWPGLASDLPYDHVDRTVRVRVEEPR